MRSTIRATAVLAALAFAATAAVAQVPVKPGIGLGLVGGYYSLGGDDFTGTDAGFGGEVSVRFGLTPAWSFLGGVGMSSHDVSGETLTNLRVSIEPRYMFSLPAPSPITPFIGVRGGWTRSSATVGGTDYSQSGFIAGGTGGVLIRIAPSLKFEGAVTFGTASFGDTEANGTTIANSDASGTILALQLGIVWTMGR